MKERSNELMGYLANAQARSLNPKKRGGGCSWIHEKIPLLIYPSKQAQNTRLSIVHLWERQNLTQIELPVLRTGSGLPRLSSTLSDTLLFPLHLDV